VVGCKHGTPERFVLFEWVNGDWCGERRRRRKAEEGEEGGGGASPTCK